MDKEKSRGRRDFLKTAAAGTAAVALNPGMGKVFGASGTSGVSPLNKWPGKVVVNFNKDAVKDNKTIGNDQIKIIKKMVDDAILKLTGETTIGAAWKAIFPASLAATSKIAIKVNTLNSGLPAPHWSSVLAITDGLQQMDVGGAKFPAANIAIYEMAGNLSTAGYSATNFPNISIKTDTAVDGGDGALNNRTYAQTLKNADFLINVFSPRGHSFPSAGSKFTLGFKSHYGTYSDPTGLHTNYDSNFQKIVCTGVVFKKLVLSVCSGINGMNEGNGPFGNADIFTTYVKSIDTTATTQCPSTIMMSTDPVSAEMQAIKLMRINKGGKYGKDDMPPYLKASAGIDVTGITPTYNIGTIDESKMSICSIVNETVVNCPTAVNSPASFGFHASAVGISAHQIAGHGSVFIDFMLPDAHVGKEASIEIYNTRGSLVKTFSQKVLGVRNHLSWDEKDSRGSLVSKGIYVARLSLGEISQSARFSIVR
jgi:hypothetical protein